MKTLVKTDKNGTKYFYNRCRCCKCGGTGIINCYIPINGGECFDCGGSGFVEYETKEYTPEYEEKLEARRQARLEKKITKEKALSGEKNQEFFERQGFNSDGITYSVLGNTYEIKEELKSKGAKWSNQIGWHFPEDHEEYSTVEISVDDVYFKDYADTYHWNNIKSPEDETYSAKIEAATEAIRPESTSEFFGEVGKRYDLTLIFKRMILIENVFRTGYWSNDYDYLYIFTDEASNEYTWKTSLSMPEATDGQVLKVKGTVKEHKEYKGRKQTVLTRCKISE